MSTGELSTPAPATDAGTATWALSDFPYGVAPLTIPPPVGSPAGKDGPHDPAAAHSHGDVDKALTSLLEATEDHGATPLGPPESSDRLFWFRWITGHQATFILWQLAAREIPRAEAEQDRHRRADLADAIADFAEAYSAMLLYTSSCPRDVYHALIRPSMFLQHRGFSGTWAPDFVPVRDLFRGRPQPWLEGDAADRVQQAVRTYGLVHAGVAAKLVPSGRSLLQQATQETPMNNPELRSVVYDNYFMTLRAPTAAADIAAQLLSRLEAVGLDVIANGLYPATGDGPDELPEELATGDGARCERDFFPILRRAAVTAAAVCAPGR